MYVYLTHTGSIVSICILAEPLVLVIYNHRSEKYTSFQEQRIALTFAHSLNFSSGTPIERMREKKEQEQSNERARGKKEARKET